MLKPYRSMLRRDLILAIRQPSEALNSLLFLSLIVTLFPLGVSPEPSQLKIMAPGVVWIAALLSGLFSLESLFRSDFEDGALEQAVLGPSSLPLLVLAKVTAHWLVSGLPVILVAPFLALLLSLPWPGIVTLEWTLLLGTPLLSLIGAVGVALTLGLGRGGMLLTLLIMPLYIPILIFATQAVSAAVAGLPIAGPLYLLAALLLLALTLAPFAAAAALRISLS